MADVETEIANLSVAKKTLLARLLKRSAVHAGARAQQGDLSLPLSYAQQRLWLIHQLDPVSHLYNVPRCVRLKGDLNITQLGQALNEIVRRHEVLRTSYPAEAGVPALRIARPLQIPFKVNLDCEGDAENSLARLLKAEAIEEYRQPFDLTNGPLLRATLWRLAERDHVLLVVTHHIVSDGWTGGLLFAELGSIYDAYCRGEQHALPDLPIQYSEYAAWQRKSLAGDALAEHLDYWREQLTGARTSLDLPCDRRKQRTSYHGATVSTRFSAALTGELKSLCEERGVTLFSGMLSGLKLLLSRWTGSDDITVGTVGSNRDRTEVEKLIGCFVNFLPLRTRLEGSLTVSECLSRVNKTVMEAFEHQECPFERLVEATNPERSLQANPLFDVALVMQHFPEIAFVNQTLEARFLPLDTKVAFLDLRFVVYETPTEIRVDCEYSTELFDESTVVSLLSSYVDTLGQMVGSPAETKLQSIRVSPDLLHQAGKRPINEERIAVAATFTSEPVAEAVEFWMRKLGTTSKIQFAGYNQVFQQLLDPQSLFARNTSGVNAVLLRLEDWTAPAHGANAIAAVERTGAEFVASIETSSIPHIVCFCPPSSAAIDKIGGADLQRLEDSLAAQLNSMPHVNATTSAQILSLYPTIDHLDQVGSKLGQIPYTPAFFSSLGTILARRIYALRSIRRKVIAVDCDQTLWRGVCGEDGAQNVEVGAPQQALQEFLIQQQEKGMLLCLVSKNHPADVDAVFRHNAGMKLRPDHITARRIDWQSKSQNLRELANELNLGLDSFIFVDDNPLECAEVRAANPEVLVLELPAEPGKIPQYLKQVWAFDSWKLTKEDKHRAGIYRQERERDELRKTAVNMDKFLAGLNLHVDIHVPRSEELNRLSQLTERTNQFNATSVRRSPGELLRDGRAGLAVEVRDRFGDYGLVGLMLYQRSGEALEVDTFLLSCRALGRRVENQMLERLGHAAFEAGFRWVDILFTPSERNRPARDFLEYVTHTLKGIRHEGGYRLLATDLTELRQLAILESSKPAVAEKPAQNKTLNRMKLDLIPYIADHLCSIDAIRHAIETEKLSNGKSEPHDGVAPRSPVEELIAGIWVSLLKTDQVGIHDNFFRHGGHSLLAAQLVARIHQVTHVELTLRVVFESPTVAGLAARVEATWRTGEGGEFSPLKNRPRIGDPALSSAQQRLWFLNQLEPQSAFYNIPQRIRLRGTLDIDVLERSVNEIVRRHEALRTTFDFRCGRPAQIIAPIVHIPVTIVDLRGLQGTHQADELERELSAAAAAPFDLKKGPLLRVHLVQLGEQESVLLFCVHHIVSDRWSIGVFSQELTILYSAFIKNAQSPLPELTIQYADYSDWQSERLSGSMIEKEVRYWKQKLSGAPAVIDLPTDRPRPAEQSYRGGWVSRLLPDDLVRQAKALGQVEGATLFMTLLAAFHALLSRYSRQQDIVVGSPIAGRSHTETQSLIGFFVNTVAIRTEMPGDVSFRCLLARVREAAIEAYAHQDVPFEKLVEELDPPRSLSYNPIFQVMFALQNASIDAGTLPGIELTREPMYLGASAFDLSCFAIEVEGGVLLRTDYSSDLFDRATIERMLEHFQTLIEHVLAEPDRAIAGLPLLTPAQQQQIVSDLNATARDYPKTSCIHDFLAGQSAEIPDAVALIDGATRMTYRQLNARANQLAHYLVRHGAGPDVLIGIYLRRSADMVAAILGVLKAGSAYVPLDSNYPKERLGNILEDATPRLVLTETNLVTDLAGLGQETICLDHDEAWIAKEPSHNPASTVSPSNLAYVLFTSGSTGRPKGVALEHRSAVTFIRWVNEILTPADLAGVLFGTSICFDMSTFEMFVTIGAGGKIILAQNALELPALPAKDEVTIINTVPSVIAELVRAGGLPGSVKTLALAGEALPDALVEQIYASSGVEHIYNLYGPTENGYSTSSPIERGKAVTIGKPIANCQAYVLDSGGSLAPLGVPGELYLAGDGLARGYYRRPELTAERFLRNPFSMEPGARMYKTGDLCRWLPDGNIQYYGRLDRQVKLRGFRIELGEIEATLERLAVVRQSIVVLREDEPGRQTLVAYLLLDSNSKASVAEIRDYAVKTLPEFMVPSSFVVLDAMPLTQNGKVDRNALPRPIGLERRQDVSELRSPVEELVAGIWSEVLRVRVDSGADNFFALGGHSLLGTQVISRVREIFGIELPLRTIFQAPQLSDFAAAVEAAKRVDHPGQLPPLQPTRRDQLLPLSFAQQRIWFLDQLEPNNPFYNIPCSLRAHFEIDADTLERSLNFLIERHESLRTRFVSVDGEARQVIDPELRINLVLADFGSSAQPKTEAEAKEFLANEARRPFDLAKGPLIRALLLRLNASETILFLNVHHIVSDRWSMGVLLRDLSALYKSLRGGSTAALKPLALQYADFAAWQRSVLADALLEDHLGYWRQQMAGAPPLLDIPTDRPRQAVETFRGDTVSFKFRSELTEQIQSLSRREGTTLFMALLAGFQTLLFRYSGQDDLVIGTPVASRSHPQLEPLIGFFANTLPLRARLHGEPTFKEMLRRTKETALDAYAHQDLPFEKLVEDLQPERNLSYTPLVQTFFVLQNAPQEGLELSGLDLELLETDTKTAKGDLFLSMAETAEGLGGRIEYNTDLFERRTIEGMWRHYERLLAGAAANPEQRVSELPLLGEEEREELLNRWNATAASYPDCCVHESFEQQGRQAPQAIACQFDEERLTYQELNEKANQLAHYLAERGAQPGQRVGVYLERSFDLLIALLAVQKTGAAYVPVDPGYPAERSKQILEQAQVKVLVTDSILAASVAENPAVVVCLDQEQAAITGQSKQNLGRRAQPEDAIYVIFTSGSTGRPKGVEVPHRAVVNLLTSMAQELHMGPADVFPALASFAFDMCIPELYLALVTGGTVALGRARLAADGEELAAFLEKTGATIVHATPTTWRLLLDAGFTGKGLKRAVGAEALPPELCRRLLEAEPSLYNFYGPTETTVWSTLQHFRSADEAVSIGRPLANTRIYILDEQKQPVPVGVEGELYIGGAGVAHGYLHQPALTAERFVSDPFVGGAKLYRTGDRARYRADGRIEYRGRSDFQVKLRGYRIELGEIEAVLVQHTSVAQSVASVREDRPGDQRLVAYVVAQAGAGIDEAELRAWVKARLPEYMVPVRVVAVERFALTPNGKVDRKQLPAVEYRRQEGEEAYQAARTPVEEVLAGIWGEVLKLEQVGMGDDFFQLGGHSLLGTQVMSRVRAALNVEMPLRALFEAPTVRGLAQKVEALRQGGGLRLWPRLERQARPAKLPLSFAQQRLWFLDQLEPGNELYNVPYLVRLQGELDGRLLERSLQEIAQRHEALRTRFVLAGDEPVQVIDDGVAVALQRVELTEGTAEERLAEARRQVLAEIRRPFDLAAGPLWRTALYSLGAQEHVFVLCAHHIISDRWSLGVLAEELAALYEAFAEGKPSPLPDLPVQYADYALWQRVCLTEERLAPQLDFWKQHLAGAPPALNLPVDHPHGSDTTNDGAGVYRRAMPENLVRELRMLSRSRRVTFFMTLFSGFNVLLSHYTGQNDLVLGTDLANRSELNTEKLIGFFVNLLPFRTKLADTNSLSDLLVQSREITLNGFANQHVQFDRIVEELQPERIPGRHPLVQVLFVMQNIPQTASGFGGLTAGPVGVTNRSRFDLVLFVNNPDTNPILMWMYNPRLFAQATISRLATLYETLLSKMASDPEVTLASLKQTLDETIANDRATKKAQFQEASRKKLGSIRRRPRSERETVI